MTDTEEANAGPSSPTKILRSRRKKCLKKGKSNESSEKAACSKWTVKEIKILHDGLQKFGLTRLENIANLFPHRSIDQVKLCLWKIGKDVHRSSAKERELANAYNISGGETSVGVSLGLSGRGCKRPPAQVKQLSALTRSLLLIENLEEHPPCSGPNEIDFPVLYKSLYMLMKGYPLPDMNEPTQDFFCECIYNLLQTASSHPIESFPLDETETLEGLANHSGFNPLSFTLNNLKARVETTEAPYDKNEKLVKDWISKYDWSLI